MMRNIAINGQFTARKMTGQERFACRCPEQCKF